MRLPFFSALLLLPLSIQAAEPLISAEANEFFEKKIRPVLVDRCYECHGALKQKGGLRLDSKTALLKGSDDGPVIVVGKPDESSLIKAIRYQGENKMPPKGKLPDETIQALIAWVKMGAPFPETVAPTGDAASLARSHWAFQPVRDPAPPEVAGSQPDLTPLDRFVLAPLQKQGRSLSLKADKRTLIRRATYDLTGLPPTPEEAEAFIKDKYPDAFAKVVDRLLASPAYGEAQARHWLDHARYADTKGYVFEDDRSYAFAYTYRDWVIRAFNEDLPYDKFIVDQLAADRLPGNGDPRDLAAMGFLTVGRRFLNNNHDIIDDRIDVATRTFLGLTVTCARCHDHKFDPIPIKDYYSLYGVFASSEEPKEMPLIGQPERTPEYLAFEADVKKQEAEVESLRHRRFDMQIEKLRKAEGISAYLLAVHDTKGKSNEQVRDLLTTRQLNHHVYDRWKKFLESKDQSSVWGPLNAISELPDNQFSDIAPSAMAAALDTSKDEKQVNLRIAEALKDKKFASFKELADLYGKVLAKAWSNKEKAAAEDEPLLAAIQKGGPVDIAYTDVEKLLDRADHLELTRAKKKIDEFKAKSPSAPPRAMALKDAPSPTEPVVFLRGNPNNRGPAVPRQFLAVLSGSDRKPFTDGSGRLQMARAIADVKNPLTPRVMVNRVWITLFGRGLVRTPSDFGVRCDPPTHPELLDWLSSRFIESGWSVKKLHRLIVLSAAYQQSSDAPPELLKQDPENRLLAHQNRRRLQFESLRDSLIMAAGHLDRKIGGKSVDIFSEPFSNRRSVYGYIDRQNLPGTLRAFDFATPDAHSPQRFVTTVPQQALFLMNSPFALAQARALIARPEIAGEQDEAKRITTLYRLLYARSPDPEEIELGRAFLRGEHSELEAERWQYGYGRYDAETKRVVKFTNLPHWTGSQWQGGAKIPDAKLGWVSLNAGGGHPGENPDFAAIRRWVAPEDCTVAINGSLQHSSKDGDGVRGRLISSRLGELGSWKAFHSIVETKVDRVEVKKGDTLDFVVDSMANINSDGFSWSPVLKIVEASWGKTWDAAKDFHGPNAPGLTPWEQYAQVLLLDNEFAFVD